jgi:hypothetical protein
MKTITVLLTFLLTAALLTGCSSLSRLIQTAQDVETITPSDVTITESRDVTGFDAITFSTFGKVNLTQGDSESLTITGSDNIVPLIKTTVENGRLVIETEKPLSILNMNKENILTFDITVKDLTGLTVSGAGDFSMDALTTTSLDLVMSGAGNVTVGQFTAEKLDVNLSGVGGLEIAGKVTEEKIEISGAGGVKAGDLECQSATTNITGLGSITVWVTDQLDGTISGAGSVSYYGDPQTNTNSSGVGTFKPLGNK